MGFARRHWVVVGERERRLRTEYEPHDGQSGWWWGVWWTFAEGDPEADAARFVRRPPLAVGGRYRRLDTGTRSTRGTFLYAWELSRAELLGRLDALDGFVDDA